MRLENFMRALVCLVFLVGCTKRNPNYCENEPDHLCRDGGGMACTSSVDCTGADKVCKLPEQTCVQCTTAEASACTGTTPICTNDRCAPCTKHADCAESNACMPDGSCAVSSEVLYVKTGATNNSSCSKASPCGDVQAALAVTPPKPTIKVEGVITASAIQIDNRDVILLGQDATLRNTGSEILTVSGTSKVRLYDLTLTGAAGNIGASSLSGHTGELELQRCTVTGNAVGIQLAGNTSTLILGRSTVSYNTQGGVVLLGSANRFDITNNFIFRNGNKNNAPYGGLGIEAVSTMMSRLEFNTIVDNDAAGGSTRSGGVKCDIMNFAAPNNIVARNSVGNSTIAANAQTFGLCGFTGSLVQNDVAGLAFVKPDVLDYNYRIMPGSIAIDKATTGAAIMIDVDGESRPNGMARDVGADELH